MFETFLKLKKYFFTKADGFWTFRQSQKKVAYFFWRIFFPQIRSLGEHTAEHRWVVVVAELKNINIFLEEEL